MMSVPVIIAIGGEVYLGRRGWDYFIDENLFKRAEKCP